MEGKDIRVKMGLGKKEHAQKALKQIKDFSDSAKIQLRKVRQDLKPTIAKLSKIVGKDEIAVFEDLMEKLIKKQEKELESMAASKTKEINQS